ncbi:SDR family NAD(P)-dependent oxidoreductase [Nocardiopsis coralliicola]
MTAAEQGADGTGPAGAGRAAARPPADRGGDRPVAAVTGAGGGIGAATARRFAADGHLVIVNDIDPDAAAATVRTIAAERAAAGDASGSAAAVAVPGDASAPETAEAVLAAVRGPGGGRLDVLVNNVGDFRPNSRTFLRSTPEKWQRLYEVNLLHVFRMTHALLPLMTERGSGAVVNVSTVEAFRGIPGNAAYSAFNAGVAAFTRSLAVEVGRHGVRVNAIAPDLIDTPQTPAEAMLRGRDPDLVRTWVPLARFGTPDDCTDAVAFLASPAARFTTGHTLPVDGGTLTASGWYAQSDGPWWTNMPDRA